MVIPTRKMVRAVRAVGLSGCSALACDTKDHGKDHTFPRKRRNTGPTKSPHETATTHSFKNSQTQCPRHPPNASQSSQQSRPGSRNLQQQRQFALLGTPRRPTNDALPITRLLPFWAIESFGSWFESPPSPFDPRRGEARAGRERER